MYVSSRDGPPAFRVGVRMAASYFSGSSRVSHLNVELGPREHLEYGWPALSILFHLQVCNANKIQCTVSKKINMNQSTFRQQKRVFKDISPRKCPRF